MAMSEETAPLAVPTSVKERRKALKWSQERLGQEAGISTTAVHNLEAGKNGFTDKTLAALAKALGCTPAQLLMPMEAEETQPIVGDSAILAVLARIEGLTEKDVDMAFAVISNAISVNKALSAPSEHRDQPPPATRRREPTPS